MTDNRYTGQRSEGFGLLDYNARYYDPALGRFISADTIIPQPGNPLAWDRFSYGRNNPINYTDPSGHVAVCGTTVDDCQGGRGGAQGPLQPTPIIYAPDDALDNVWNVTEVVGGVVFEPADWIITGAHCLQGDCSPYVLLGLLPFLPSSAARYLDDIPVGWIRNGDELLEIGRWTLNAPNMPADARLYQQYITGAEPGWEFLRNGVHFDGARMTSSGNMVLMDAKYAGAGSGSFYSQVNELPFAADKVLEDAQRQMAAAADLSVEWYVSDATAAKAISDLFQANGININVVNVPWVP